MRKVSVRMARSAKVRLSKVRLSKVRQSMVRLWMVRWSMALGAVVLCLAAGSPAHAQSFIASSLDFDGQGDVLLGTSLTFGPDGRLYVLELGGTIKVITIQRDGFADYVAVDVEVIQDVLEVPNHDDDGAPASPGYRLALGLAVGGSASNPVVYAASSDPRIGGPSGDTDLDTNSGVITRLTWQGTDRDDPEGAWEVVDIVRGLPRSEENHATNGLELVDIGGVPHLLVSQGGHTNAGAPSTNFAWHTEYALSAAVLAIDLGQIAALPVQDDDGRSYVYDLPTLDDPTRPNANGIPDPDAPGYDGVDVGDPWGGDDGLNQAKLVPGGPVQIFSPGYRNTYDLVVTASGAVYVTDNGANQGWGGYPEGEGLGGGATNAFRPGEPGSNGPDEVYDEPQVNNLDHLTLVTTDVQTYAFGSLYAGHPTPVRANPAGAGLFARGAHSADPGDTNGNGFTDDWFRTVPYDPDGTGDAADPQRALPADWPPVPLALADPVEGDYRNPGEDNPDGPDDAIVTIWGNNTNGIDEYTASSFGGAMQGDLIAGQSGGLLHRVQLAPDGSLETLTEGFVSGLPGNPLGITANGDADPFPGTIWIAPFNEEVIVLEPQDSFVCTAPGDADYDPLADDDSDGYTNEDEEQNGTDPCNGGAQPRDFDRIAGAPFVSDLNDPDDDEDGIPDAEDVLQLGDPAQTGSDAFALPVVNELFSDDPVLRGYLGLGLTGLMNNGAAGANWLDWIDQRGAGPNPNDILGGAVGAMTMQMTAGTALGAANDQEKAFQYGVDVDLETGGFVVEGRLLNFGGGLQLYPFAGPGELGIFMGDGTQSSYVKLVVTKDGVEVLQEVDDVPQAPLSVAIAPADRPDASMVLRLEVDSTSGQAEAFYAVDDGPAQSIGSLAAEGAILHAIQQPGVPLAVGLIGTSNTPGAEVEGTWDRLSVVGRRPTVASPLPDVSETVGAVPSIDVDLDASFDDDEGDGNLTYAVVSNTNPAFEVTLVGSTLSIVLPSMVASTTVTVRATDTDGYAVEQSFEVAVADPVALYRVNAGGPAVASLDGGIDWEPDTQAAPSPRLADWGSNSTFGFDVPTLAPEVDPVSTPAEIFQTERYDEGAGEPRMHWAFPVPEPGAYQLRLYMANGYPGTSAPGDRVFGVEVEGVVPPALADVDLAARFGHAVGGVVAHDVQVDDGTLDVVFLHGPANNPVVDGIEVIGGAAPPPGDVPLSLAAIPDRTGQEGESIALPALASGGDTPGSYLFAATGLPPGLQIEPTTGLIFGTIAAGALADSPYAVSVEVDDLDADPDDTTSTGFTWTVVEQTVGWIPLDEDEGYTARHECSFVQAGDRFYLFGGRESPATLDTYDYAADAWTTSATAPLPFNHFQAVEHEGLVWVVGAFEDNAFPAEEPADHVWVFDPANDVWIQGPEIPAVRRRGSTGLVARDGRLYVVGGNTIGHDGGYVSWLDEYDPVAGTWTPLADAPHARDHFHAAVVGDRLFVAGGRLSGGPGGVFAPLVPEVDVYDFTTGSWSTLPMDSDLPTPRAAAAVGVFEDRILVIGGEGDGQAYDTVEALDPDTATWETLAPLNHARHGTQAIVSGGGVYVTAGSPFQGGGNQRNMEVYGEDAPAGTPSTPGVLSAPASADVSDAAPTTVALEHAGGGQGIVISSISIGGPDAADFSLTAPLAGPVLLPAGASRSVEVAWTGATEGATATLDVVHSGSETASVTLTAVPEPGLASGLFAGLLGLRALARRRRRVTARPGAGRRPEGATG